MTVLSISKTTQRRFVLGKQGLYPGRRWQGKDGIAAAMRAGAVVQIDPISVVARSPDIALYGRVMDYQPALLETLLYEDRVCFEPGGVLMVHPIEELPYWRVIMARKQQESRRAQFAEEYGKAIEIIRQAIASRGPLRATDFREADLRASASFHRNTFRSDKVANRALDYLWVAGEVLTHHRQGLERVFELRERLVPAQYDTMATAEEADAYFALDVVRRGGLMTPQFWRTWYAGIIARPVSKAEASACLEALITADAIAQVRVEDDASAPYIMLADDLPLLESLHRGHIPDAWQPLETTTEEEMVFLAPLEFVSARGRASGLFDFEYIWEVYKPPEQRRWGYYVLPILYQDRLVARVDLRLERSTNTLLVKGFWLEAHAVVTDQFVAALARGFQRFMRFTGATALDAAYLTPPEVRDRLRDRVSGSI